MCEKEAVIELAKHFGANLVAGILHALIGFSIALIAGAFIPVQIPINSLNALLGFASTVGLGAGLLGMVLAVENDSSEFKATRVFRFVREAVYPESRRNGSQHRIFGGLMISSKLSWQDYVLYI